ncbi:MAG: GPR endopeptidase [Clostridiales bacterium GWF2_36_10]|nr:MAG: GPR endopeptidase [Clostridiales bacterium GWF2_36_10]HAN21859.1 GPR endopeptidase [Clostridiales bacterium]
MENYTRRTDLALEAHEINAEKGRDDGVIVEEKEIDGINVTTTEVKEGQGENLTGKPAGIYTTVDIGRVWQYDSERFNQTARVLSDLINSLLPQPQEEKTVLVAGLGNMDITPDSIGPKVISKVIVTRHIRTFNRELYDKIGFGNLSAISPGVLGQTGIESAEIIKSVIDKVTPYCVILVDALASRKLSRLATTVQLCDTGIRPGAGVANNRVELNNKSLGVPVVSIGVPTVVDAATLAYDLLEELGAEMKNGVESSIFNEQYDKIVDKLMSGSGKNMFVSPKESDVITRETARLISTAINLSLHKGIDIKDMGEYLT